MFLEKIFADETPKCEDKDCGGLVKPGVYEWQDNNTTQSATSVAF